MRTSHTAISILLMLLVPCMSQAAGFSGISISPTSPIAEDESIVLTATGWTDGSTGYLYAPTEISVTDMSIEVVLNVTSSCAITGGICLAVVIDYEESVTLGVLAPGTYDLDVEMRFTAARLVPGFPMTTSLGHRSTTFTVIPEPAAPLLLGAGLAFLAKRRR